MNRSRAIGLWPCVALVVGNTIGMGIFMLPASLAPFGLNALLGWFVTLGGCLAIARVLAGLARHAPSEDGPHGWVRAAFGDGVAFAVLWSYWVSVWVTNASLSLGIVAHVSELVPLPGAWTPTLVALALPWLFVLVNAGGVRFVGVVQVLTTLLKLLPLVTVVGLGSWVFVAGVPATVPKTELALSATVAASSMALFAMLGMESATVPAGRVHEPERTIPRATVIGTFAATLVYVAVSAVPMLLVPQEILGKSDAPLATLIDRVTGRDLGLVLAAFVVVSGLGALNGWTLLAGELTRSFAARGTFPGIFGRVDERGTPLRALVLTASLTTVMICLSKSESLVQAFTFLILVVTAANLPLYLFCCASVLVLWRLGRLGERPEFGLALAAACGIAFSLWAFVGVGRASLILALLLAAIGVPVYLLGRFLPARS